jgi:hypothetical protein
MIYDNQKTCGKNILEMFNSNNPVVLLLAQMQMGKSGTYWYVIREALKVKLVDKVLLISGNREKDLRQQINNDLISYTQDNQCLRNKITVLWGSALYSKQKPIVDVHSNTLIVWDEAHYAQSTSNGPYKFFQHNKLDGMLNGSMKLDDILQKRVFLLTVSATPFSELYANHISHCKYHKVIHLTPDNSYYGVDYYIKTGRLKESFVINDNTTPRLENVLSNHNNINDPKYILIRVCRTTKQYAESSSLIVGLCKKLNMKCHVMNSVCRTITISDLNVKPRKPTVVIVSGMLRMGKVVPKEHIAMVFEEKTVKNTRLIDTGLQGLLGRMCGYSNSSGFNIDVYVEPKIIQTIYEYSKSYNSVEGPIINPATNLKKSITKSKSKIVCYELADPKCSTKKSLMNQIHTQYPELLKYNMRMMNLLKNCNSNILEQLENCTELRLRIEPDKCYVCKLFSGEYKKVWLLIRDIEQISTQEPNEIDILRDLCVFKPISNQ